MALYIVQAPLNTTAFKPTPVGQQLIFAVRDTWAVTNRFNVKYIADVHISTGAIDLNTTTDRIDFSQLSNKAHVIFRFGIKVNPTVDNTTLKLRLFWTMSTGSTYEVDVPGALLNDGAGIEYENEFTLPFYVGNDITKNGYGIVQVKADGDCTITDSAFLTIVG